MTDRTAPAVPLPSEETLVENALDHLDLAAEVAGPDRTDALLRANAEASLALRSAVTRLLER